MFAPIERLRPIILNGNFDLHPSNFFMKFATRSPNLAGGFRLDQPK